MARGPHSARREKRARAFSVRAHLAAIVGVLAVTLVGLGAFQSSNDFRAARRQANLDTAFQARLAAGALTRSLGDASSFAAGTAGSPSIAQLFETIDGRYALCSLSGGGTGVFPDGSIHFLDRTGFLFCSSAADKIYRRGLQYGRQAWFARTLDVQGGRSAQLDPFVDPATGKLSIGLAAPVKDGAGRSIGVVVYALPVSGVAGKLKSTYGGRAHLAFDLVRTSSGQLVSSSEVPPGDPAGGRPHRLQTSLAAPFAGLDGVRRQYQAAPAGRTGFTVVAGVSEALTLANARDALRGHISITVLALLVTLALGLLVNRRIGRPLRRLSASVEQAGRAVMPEPVTVDGPREVRQLVERFNGMLATQADYDEQLRQRAMFDPLTGLPNRAVVLDRLSHALERTRREPDFVAVLSIDLDRFSIVNESLGRDVGDRMLIVVATRIRSVLRPEDTMARFYGDEFIVVCEGVESEEEASAVADRIAASLREPLRVGALEATVSASIGIALGRFVDSAQNLLRDADSAMAEAKAAGKARHAFFNLTMRERARNRLDLENDLRHAIEHDELQLAYQPIIDLKTRRIVGAEALLRWHHPTKGVLLPGMFINLAEETGLIVPIGRRVFQKAIGQASRWSRQGHPTRVSVNLSPRQIAEPGLGQEVRAALEEAGLDPTLLCVEVTESTLMREDGARDVLEGLKGLGVAVSVDDFGTGYSSLAYLQRFPIDELKIDREFIQDLGKGTSASALVAAIVGVAKALGLSVVAEGVEEEHQLDEALALGCGAAQGFLIMRPQPADALTPLLELDAVTWPDLSTARSA